MKAHRPPTRQPPFRWFASTQWGPSLSSPLAPERSYSKSSCVAGCVCEHSNITRLALVVVLPAIRWIGMRPKTYYHLIYIIIMLRYLMLNNTNLFEWTRECVVSAELNECGLKISRTLLHKCNMMEYFWGISIWRIDVGPSFKLKFRFLRMRDAGAWTELDLSKYGEVRHAFQNIT